ncbi:hypothetical protein TREMEDRAFT_62149 [Tremella mesenterica DSM 1558]|uniref:uncharacterized protein n=1 Tax=Tremella mesenterica (strain ATCC 24925 / CBS 8224 / DSM 1558 / NBRC 9311 / NRRL Y-6157 / RJB 2259-6 / UBC 559-6) TaxID=578456 RepID=UPI0003F48DB0|nr:uncharacterized protein TREMEDRAFT_62149 [Tremella mesenterica DSM 1558]EIW69286.1 hypothetical protein TREMEDRAFT_62149 [Tremella mesenterica DSM 1558]
MNNQPPLPSGPTPYGAQDPQAAHAAAWAAYYQSQGMGTPAAYPGAAPVQPTPAPTGGTTPGTVAAATPNPYANYGYGALAIHARPFPSSGPSFRPPQYGPQQPPVAAAPPAISAAPTTYTAAPQYNGPGQVYNPPGTTTYPTTSPGPTYNTPSPGGWQGGPQPPQPGFRPPGGPGFNPSSNFRPRPPFGGGFRPGLGQNQHQHPNQPIHGGPGIGSQRPPFQPGSVRPGIGGRPPMNNPPGNFPPAKRPRFDGPAAPTGPASHQPGGPPQQGMQSMPGIHVVPGVQGVQGMQGGVGGMGGMGGMGIGVGVGPMNAPNPNPNPPRPRPNQNFRQNQNIMRVGNSQPVRPSINLGPGANNLPPNPFTGTRGIVRNVNQGPVNAPKGPSGQRRDRKDRESTPKREKEREKRRREGDREMKTTMTDFRIVGIEMSSLGWKWGMTSDEMSQEESLITTATATAQQVKESESVKEKIESVPSVKQENEKEIEGLKVSKDGKEINGEVEGSGIEEVEGVVKSEQVDSNVGEGEKAGSKRKAETPGTDGDSSASPKKRPVYLMTHNKLNTESSFDNNQNRFRIYFESPPELDRIPKALRRGGTSAPSGSGNPNKRGRRESSSVVPDSGNVDPSLVVEPSLVAGSENGVKVGDVSEIGVNVGIISETTVNVENTTETVKEDQLPPTENQGEAQGVVENSSDNIEISVSGDTEQVEVPLSVPAISAEETTSQLQETSLVVQDEQVNGVSQDTRTQQPVQSEVEGEENPGDISMQSIPDPNSLQVENTTTDVPKVSVDGSIDQTASEIKQNENIQEESDIPRTRHSSVSSFDDDIPQPSLNRLSILYEDSSRRLCLDAEIVETVRVFRGEGKIEVVLKVGVRDGDGIGVGGQDEKNKFEGKEGKDGEGEKGELPKGILVEMYDPTDQRFISVPWSKLHSTYSLTSFDSLPPFHLLSELTSQSSIQTSSSKTKSTTSKEEGIILTVHLNKRRPLSEPKWCRNNSADEWLIDQFPFLSSSISPSNSSSSHSHSHSTGWFGKLEIVDPDPPPTLETILETWSTTSTSGTNSTREEFVKSLLENPGDMLEILLRLTRGDRNPPVPIKSTSIHIENNKSKNVLSSKTQKPTPNDKDVKVKNSENELSNDEMEKDKEIKKKYESSLIRSDSPYTSHQTHVSLAVLAMFRLTTDYAKKVGEEEVEKVWEKVEDIVRSLPSSMINRSLEGMFKEWSG